VKVGNVEQDWNQKPIPALLPSGEERLKSINSRHTRTKPTKKKRKPAKQQLRTEKD
jgi:hypothetical protein